MPEGAGDVDMSMRSRGISFCRKSVIDWFLCGSAGLRAGDPARIRRYLAAAERRDLLTDRSLI